MIPGPDQILACPYCGLLVKQQTLLSGNTFGADLWTDGKRAVSMLPEFTEIVRCRGCNRYYWIDEAKVKGEMDPFDDKLEGVPEEWKHAELTQHLSVEEYIEALDSGLGYTIQKERYLRLRFWWAVNDIVRQNANEYIPTKYQQKLSENLSKLFLLLDEHEPRDRIMKAEIARETGNFPEAIRLLEDIPAEFRRVSDFIKELSKQGNRLVTKLLL